MSDLKTDYRDDVLDVSANTKRIFNLVDQDGNIVATNVSIQDVTKYTQEGDTFGAADINATNEAVNGKLDGSSTVNPMLATEPGFAADAYQTKLQLESCFQSVSNGKALVASAITGKGVTTDSDAAFSTMANNIINIKDVANNTPGTATPDMLTEGFTAWVNGKLIVGTRPLGAKRLSGTVTHGAGWGDVVTNTIKFATPFDTIPTVSLAGSKCTEHDFDQLYVGSVNTTGFTYVFEPGGTPGLGHSTVVINWVAYV